jgi:hypothetical protein
MLKVPEGTTLAGGASVACGLAVGAAEPPVLGAEVGAEVGAAAWGVAVADDPQANNSATNNRTIAFRQMSADLRVEFFSDILSPFLRFYESL